MNATNSLDSTQLEEQLKRLREDLKLSQEEINKLFNKHGCSNKNLTGQKIFIDTGHTKLKLPPEAGNLDPLTLLNVSSKIHGLEAVVR